VKKFLQSVLHGLSLACGTIFDLCHAALLALVRLVQRFSAARLTRRVLRVGWRTLRVSTLVALLVSLALGAGWLCFERVPSGHVGVRQRNFGGAGLDPQDHPAGLVLCIKGLHSLHLVETRTQVLAFAWAAEGGNWPALDVRTSDENTVNISVAVPYRVRRGEAHQLVAEGLKLAYPLRVKSATEKVLLEELGQLSSEQLMRTDLREERMAHALERLKPILAQFHVEAEAVLVTQVLFKGEYEKKLQQKQLTLQEAQLHRAATEVEEAKKQVELYQQETEAAVRQLVVDWDGRIQERYAEGQRKIVEVQAEAHFYEKTRRAAADAEASRRIAEGERALTQAEAQKTELVNKTYGTAGGRVMLARHAAENLNIRSVTLNSNDPRVPSILDIDELAQRLLGDPRPAPKP
jgi:regulator of protease activity HflC (stomatin/prohibitin superfamily)